MFHFNQSFVQSLYFVSLRSKIQEVFQAMVLLFSQFNLEI